MPNFTANLPEDAAPDSVHRKTDSVHRPFIAG